MMRKIRLGISTCPNDTFLFSGLLRGEVAARDLELELELFDVEELNRRLARGELDVAKASFAAALRLSEEVVTLPVGAALGFGVGPLLLAAKGRTRPEAPVRDGSGRERVSRVLCPGEGTTATLLYRMFHPGAGRVEHVVFSDILPALEDGTADFGVCIHEARFTWQRTELSCVEDLGLVWERATGSPLPLGGIFARRDLPADVLHSLVEALRASLVFARENRDAALETMRRHAQELDEDTLWAHVATYVGPFTEDLGETGRQALATLARRANEAGVGGTCPLEVFPGQRDGPPDLQ